MYTRLTRSGPRSYLQLVQGYRDAQGKVKQRVVASLGRVDKLKAEGLTALIEGLQRAVGAWPPIPVESYDSNRRERWARSGHWINCGSSWGWIERVSRRCGVTVGALMWKRRYGYWCSIG